MLAGAEASDDSTFHLASREVDEPILPYPTRGRTLWWQWTPPQQGLAVVTLDGIDPDSGPRRRSLYRIDEGGPSPRRRQ